MKAITFLEAIEQHPKTIKEYEDKSLREQKVENDILIGLINEVISRNIFKLEKGSVITERVNGLTFTNMENICPLYKDFKMSTLGNSDTICIIKK